MRRRRLREWFRRTGSGAELCVVRVWCVRRWIGANPLPTSDPLGVLSVIACSRQLSPQAKELRA